MKTVLKSNPKNSAQAQDGPVMKINDVQGWIRGKLMNTTGNLGREPRTIYGYRNIPYAKSFETSSILPQPCRGCTKRFQVCDVAVVSGYRDTLGDWQQCHLKPTVTLPKDFQCKKVLFRKQKTDTVADRHSNCCHYYHYYVLAKLGSLIRLSILALNLIDTLNVEYILISAITTC